MWINQSEPLLKHSFFMGVEEVRGTLYFILIKQVLFLPRFYFRTSLTRCKDEFFPSAPNSSKAFLCLKRLVYIYWLWYPRIAGCCQSNTIASNYRQDLLYIIALAFNPLAPELFFFLISTHTVYKMWIIQEPKKLALWNKPHFEEKKLRV